MVNLPRIGLMLRRLLIIVPVVLALILVSLFFPARQVTIKDIGRLSFETKVTLSVGSQAPTLALMLNPSVPVEERLLLRMSG